MNLKVLRNWRYYVMFALSTVGFLFSLAAAGEEPVVPMTFAAEMWLRFKLAVVAASSWYAFYRCVKYWEAKGQIPEFSNMEDESKDLWD